MTWKIDSKLRQTLEMERGAVVKDWGGKIPIALVFANTYHAGMSNLGFQEVYGLLNAYADVVCERFFLPDKETYREHVRTGTPILSLESRRPLTDFTLAAFSLAFENDYPNLLRILELAGLAWRSEDRKEGDPLILAGGVTMRLNPEPLADFIDLILLGDGEVLIPGLLRAWREVQDQPLPPKEILRRLARSIPGAYVPALRVVRQPQSRGEAGLGPPRRGHQSFDPQDRVRLHPPGRDRTRVRPGLPLLPGRVRVPAAEIGPQGRHSGRPGRAGS